MKTFTSPDEAARPVGMMPRPMAPPKPSAPLSGLGVGWAVTSTMVGGFLTWGGIGYLLDLLFHTQHVFMAIGFIVGAAAGTYLVYLRYGRDPHAGR